MKSTSQRLKDEQDFHNTIFESHERKKVKNYYAINTAIRRDFEATIVENSRGKTILEYGCGIGDMLFNLARGGAVVHGIDISNYAIEKLASQARREELSIDYQVMNAEDMTFRDHSFDLIYGTGILHHLDLNKALASLSKKLKADGTAVFIEPLGHNPIINRFRDKTPELRTEDEHPLLMSDFEIAKQYFDKVTVDHYYLSSLALPVLFKRGIPNGLIRFFDGVDRMLFSVLPFTRKYSWQVLIRLAEPKK